MKVHNTIKLYDASKLTIYKYVELSMIEKYSLPRVYEINPNIPTIVLFENQKSFLLVYRHLVHRIAGKAVMPRPGFLNITYSQYDRVTINRLLKHVIFSKWSMLLRMGLVDKTLIPQRLRHFHDTQGILIAQLDLIGMGICTDMILEEMDEHEHRSKTIKLLK